MAGRSTDPLAPYSAVIAFCRTQGLRTALGREEDVWWLEIRKGQRLVGKAESRKPVPECFAELGALAAASLGRAKA